MLLPEGCELGIVSECEALFRYFETQGMYDEFGICGVSMGGQMAAHAGKAWYHMNYPSLIRGCAKAVASQRPLALALCVTPYSAAPPFTQGVLGSWCDWDVLESLVAEHLPEEDIESGYTQARLVAVLLT